MLKDLLAKLGANTKITVGVSVTPGLGLEMIEVDKNTKTINKYAYKALEYNYSTREIANYEAFKETLGELFDELKIPRKSNIILNIPNVHFGIINLPLLLTDDAVTSAIISEVEQSYIFKRHEPVVSWTEVSSNIDSENRAIAYTAIQQSALDGIKGCCEDVGCKLLSIETSYASLLKTLQYSELGKEQLKDGVTWNLMVIGQNSYSILSLFGKKIIEYYEEPLALKSFVDDEIYNAINTSAQLTLAGLPANYLYIVSETDSVSAEVLSMKIPFEGVINFLECNKYTQNEIIPPDLNILPSVALKISPEAIGSAIYQFSDFPLRFNLTRQVIADEGGSEISGEAGGYPRINIGNLEVELTPDFVKKVAGILGAALAIPALIASFVLQNYINKEQAKLDEINAKIQQYNAEIAKYSSTQASNAFDAKATAKKIVTQDRLELLYYDATGISVPNKLWVTYYTSDSAGKVDIKGKSSSVESVYSFYKSVKQLVNNADIRLYKLELESGSIDSIVSGTSSDHRYYLFEITNMTDAELNPSAAANPNAPAGQGATTPADPNAQPTAAPTNATPPAPAQPAAPTPPVNNPQPGAGNMPPNLEKIEKF